MDADSTDDVQDTNEYLDSVAAEIDGVEFTGRELSELKNDD